MADKKQLECRVCVTYRGTVFDLGMYDPVTGRHEPLGTHPRRDADRVIGDLRDRIAREGHRVSFSEVNGRR